MTTVVLQIYRRLQDTYKAGKLLPLDYRRKQLYQLARLAQENVKAIEEALFADLGKPRLEAASEAATTIKQCLDAADHLEEWTAPEKPQVSEVHRSWEPTIYPVPKGVVMIIA